MRQKTMIKNKNIMTPVFKELSIQRGDRITNPTNTVGQSMATTYLHPQQMGIWGRES
jgi:hypothetical protein